MPRWEGRKDIENFHQYYQLRQKMLKGAESTGNHTHTIAVPMNQPVYKRVLRADGNAVVSRPDMSTWGHRFCAAVRSGESTAALWDEYRQANPD